jgi:hypothetical protein
LCIYVLPFFNKRIRVAYFFNFLQLWAPRQFYTHVLLPTITPQNIMFFPPKNSKF